MSNSRGAIPDRRARWEEQWERTDPSAFSWYIEEPPRQLQDLIRQRLAPDGRALDLGCGDGVLTSHLAKTFEPTIGVDFSLAALRLARSRAIRVGVPTMFVGADVPFLPFKSESFAFAFDRGCAQNLPKELLKDYFRAVEDVLIPGGILQFMASRAKRTTTGAGLKARIRSAMGGDAHAQISGHVRSCLPASMEILTLEPFDFQMATGIVRRFTHGVFRKLL